MLDRGVRCSNASATAPTLTACTNGGIQAPGGGPTPPLLTPGIQAAVPGDFDSQYRPQRRTTRTTRPWDLGADEIPGVPADAAMSSEMRSASPTEVGQMRSEPEVSTAGSS